MTYGYPTNSAAKARELMALNAGPAHQADVRNQADVRAAGGNPKSFTDLGTAARLRTNYLASQQAATPYNNYAPKLPTYTGTTARRSSGGGGGGGGGGGPTGMTQADLEWAMSLFKGATPGALSAGNPLDLPDYVAPAARAFDATPYDQMDQKWSGAVASDRANATKASADLMAFLGSNYQNAFNQPQAMGATIDQAPGMSQQSMSNLMRAQGVDPSINNNERYYAQGADAAFDNRRRLLAAGEDRAQQSRLAQTQMDAGTTQRALDIAGMQGQTALDMQRSRALQAYQAQLDAWAREDAQTNYQGQSQEALANWQRANQVSDTNVGNQNTYKSSELQALLQLLPQLQGKGLKLPDLAALGLA